MRPAGNPGVRWGRGMQAVRICRFGALAALPLVFGPAPAGARTAPAGHAVASRTVAACRAGQLAVGGLGSSTATGTVVLTVRVTDVSVNQCALGGYPEVTFVGSSGAAVEVSAAHAGPGTAFGHPRPIVLKPSSRPTAAFVSVARPGTGPAWWTSLVSPPTPWRRRTRRLGPSASPKS